VVMKVLGCVFPKHPEDAAHLDASSSIRELASHAREEVQVKLVTDPTFEEFKATLQEFQPTLLYVAGSSSYEQNSVTGLVGPVQFRDGLQPSEALASACSGLQSVYLDAATEDSIGAKLQISGVQHAIVWPEGNHVPAVVAAQFSHTFFSAVLSLKSSIHEAFALANHVVQAHCTTITDNQYLAPSLPSLYSPIKATLPDNSSIPSPSIPGVDTAMGLALAVPGWADIRLLAPRAELRLLLTGNSTLIDSSKLSFLGEAVRALLVLEMRGLTLIESTQCSKVPANLPEGCQALRCKLRTQNGAEVIAILGGQPSVLQDRSLVEHALRMTLVADSLSLQFRLPAPGLAQPTARSSAAIAGGVPVVDAVVLTSVWAVSVLRSLSLAPTYKPLISLGIAAVGGTASCGVSALDAQRLKIIVSGQGPATHILSPIKSVQPKEEAPDGMYAGQGF